MLSGQERGPATGAERSLPGMFYSLHIHHKFPGWLWKAGVYLAELKDFCCAGLLT